MPSGNVLRPHTFTHVHNNEDEVLMAVNGEFEIFQNGAWSKVACGEPQCIPRGEEYAFRNCGSTMGRIMGVATPGGLNEYLESISPISMPRDAAKLLAISESYGILFTRLNGAPVNQTSFTIAAGEAAFAALTARRSFSLRPKKWTSTFRRKTPRESFNLNVNGYRKRG